MSPTALGPPDAPERFSLLREVGGGSMGMVYEAYDRETGHRIALKTLRRGESRYLAELKREFRLVQSVLHPNLVRLGGLFQCDDTWFITMELLDGCDFMTWVRGDRHGRLAVPALGSSTVPAHALGSGDVASPIGTGPLRLDRLGEVLPQLGAALAALHAEGLVHRDIKPSNTLITAEGRLVLLDFGLTRAVLEEASVWTIAGTPAYMAPEQAAQGAITAAADCYAVGVMLYQALTGRLPFVGALDDLLFQKRNAAPVSPRLLEPEVPVELDALCLRLLARDPDARPTAAELAAGLARPLRRSTALVSGGFVGREPELVEIHAALARATVGPGVIVVEGESGIGKTALLGEATRGLASDRALVLRGRCFEREVTAYPGIDMVVDAVAGHLRKLDAQAAYFAPRHLPALRQLFPTLEDVAAFVSPEPPARSGGGHASRRRAVAAFHELIARLATRYQVVLVIDDAQWLTEASLLLLSSLLDVHDPVPVAVLLAARGPGLLAPWLDGLACAVTRISLGPLSADESLALLRHHVPGAGADLAAMARDSAGHPYLLRELALDERGPLGQARVDDVLRDRAARLTPIERTVLDLVCAAAGPVRQRVVGRAANLTPGELSAVAELLVRQRWAVVTSADLDGTILPAHDRVRTALGAELDAPGRRQVARWLAEALEADASDDVEMLALQWRDAGDPARGARFASAAGDRAMAKLAFERAIELYELALQGTSHAPDRATTLTALAEALAAAGRGTRAAEMLLAAAALVDRTARPFGLADGRGQAAAGEGQVADDLVLRAADQLIRSGQVLEGKRLITTVLERLDIRLPTRSSAAIARLLVGRLRLRLRGSAPRSLTEPARRAALRRIDACWPVGDLLAVLDPLRSAVLHTEGLRMALEVGEPYRLARSLCTEAVFVSMEGPGKRALASARLAFAERLAREASAPQLDGYLALGTGVLHLQMGEVDDAQRYLDRAESTFERCPGAHWETGSAREFALWTLAYRGGLPELQDRLAAAVAVCAERHDPLGQFKLLAGPSRVVLLARDEPHHVLEACELQRLGLSPDEYPFLAFCALFSRVNAEIYLGRAARALAALDEARGAVRASHLLRSQFNRVELSYLHGRAALACILESAASDHPGLIRVVRQCMRALRHEQVPWAGALAATLEAGLAARTEAREAAIAALRNSHALLTTVGLGVFASAVRWQLAHITGEAPGSLWSGAVVARPDRLAHTFAPLAARFAT